MSEFTNVLPGMNAGTEHVLLLLPISPGERSFF